MCVSLFVIFKCINFFSNRKEPLKIWHSELLKVNNDRVVRRGPYTWLVGHGVGRSGPSIMDDGIGVEKMRCMRSRWQLESDWLLICHLSIFMHTHITFTFIYLFFTWENHVQCIFMGIYMWHLLKERVNGYGRSINRV